MPLVETGHRVQGVLSDQVQQFILHKYVTYVIAVQCNKSCLSPGLSAKILVSPPTIQVNTSKILLLQSNAAKASGRSFHDAKVTTNLFPQNSKEGK